MKSIEFTELLSKIDALDDDQLKTLYLQSKQAYCQQRVLEVSEIITQEELELLLRR
ncbi:hypothetical protein [Photobacterium sanguinicancri]|uniref:Uncharacterized protein n=1 Tax=Photobacterium sanguinicancri TaxID=875932 RepID=A0AAW7YBY2_9GAMM|nr:hypothetical protein [Photobacterium sanguinicancri]MDO6498092.1 hypothetical protein [Photobacterium sanguinicancri]MDO6545039.1 hypothetical protein [Photobacterium sanguinicancri]